MNRTEKNNVLGLRVITVAIPEQDAEGILYDLALARHRYLYGLTFNSDDKVIDAMASRNLSQPTTDAVLVALEPVAQKSAGAAIIYAKHKEMDLEMRRYIRASDEEADPTRAKVMLARAYACSQLHKATREILNQLLEKEKANGRTTDTDR